MHTFDKQFATRLGLLGLFPFVVLTAMCWLMLPEWIGHFIDAQLNYGVAILAFLGGLHWGLAFTVGESHADDIKKDLLWGILPAIIAWFAMANMFVGFVFQIAAFIFSYQYSKRMYLRLALPEWFVQLRFKLTCVVVSMQFLTFLAANIRMQFE